MADNRNGDRNTGQTREVCWPVPNRPEFSSELADVQSKARRQNKEPYSQLTPPCTVLWRKRKQAHRPSFESRKQQAVSLSIWMHLQLAFTSCVLVGN